MKKYNMRTLVGIVLWVLGGTLVHGMNVIKPRPMLKPETRKKIFKGKLEGHMQAEGLYKKDACKPGEYFIHQDDSEWGVCISEEAANLSGLLKSMVEGLRGGADIGYEQGNDISLDIPLGEIGGVSPTIVIKDTCDFLKQYNENKTKSTHPNHVPSLVAEVLSSYKSSIVGQSSYLYRLANIANGLKYLDCSSDMQYTVGEVFIKGVHLDPMNVTNRKNIELLHPDFQQKLFIDPISTYLMERMVKQKKIIIQYNDYIRAVACSNDGNRIFTLHNTNEYDEHSATQIKLILWDITNKNNVAQILLRQDDLPSGHPVTSMRCSSDGKMVLATFNQLSTLALFDVHDASNVKRFDLNLDDKKNEYVLDARFSQDGHSIIAVYSNGLIVRWDVQNKSRTNVSQATYGPRGVITSGDGQTIYLFNFGVAPEIVELIMINNQSEVKIIPLGEERLSKLSFDGSKAVKYDVLGKFFKLYDINHSNEISSIHIDALVDVPDNDRIRSMEFMPNGNYIVCHMERYKGLLHHINVWNIKEKVWMKDYVNIDNGGNLRCVSNTNALYIDLYDKNEAVTTMTIGNFLTDVERDAAEALVSHESDQNLLLDHLCYKSMRGDFDALSEDHIEIFKKFSSDEQNLIQDLLLKEVQPKIYDEKSLMQQQPIQQQSVQQRSYLPQWLRALWDAAYAKVFGKQKEV